MRNTLILITFLAFVSVLFGVNYFFQPFASGDEIVVTQVVPTPKPSVSPAIDTIAKLEVAKLIMAPMIVTPETKTQLPDWIIQNRPGAVVIYGTEVDVPTMDKINEQLQKLEDVSNRTGKVLLGVVYDGNDQTLSGEGFTGLPTWRQVCRQSLSQAKTQFALVSAELANVNINFVLSPSLDLIYTSSSTSTNFCSSNPQKVSQYGLAFVEAMDQFGILSVAKHFPGVGKLKQPLSREFSVVNVTKNDLLPFKNLLDKAEGTTVQRAVMVSLAGVKQSGGTACALTKECVDQVVNATDRVLIVSDDLSQKAALYNSDTEDYTKSMGEVAYEAIMAGNNLLYFGQNTSYEELSQVIDFLAKKYANDVTFRSKVDISNGLVDGIRY